MLFITATKRNSGFKGIDKILIDVTERLYRRSQDDKKQREHFRAKKHHALKNTVMSTLEKAILFLGRTFTGKNHDYGMLKKEFSPEEDWFTDFQVWVDLGYLGIIKDYSGKNIFIPHKNPRKSKNKPVTELTQTQKMENRALSKVRILLKIPSEASNVTISWFIAFAITKLILTMMLLRFALELANS